MRLRAFEFRLPRVQGVPGILLLLAGAVLIAGIVGVVLFLGAIVAAIGLVGSVGAALYFRARRFLAKETANYSPVEYRVEDRPAPRPAHGEQVREIEVEVVPERRS